MFGKGMKKWFFLASFAFLLSSCGGDDGDTPEPLPVEKAPLTVLAYLVANNNLDDELLANIGIMYDGLADMDKPATLLVYWDGRTTMGDKASNHLILKYETDGKGNVNGLPALDESSSLDEVVDVAQIVKEYSEQRSTDKAVMSRVLQDMVRLSPTERVGLVVGSHGSAWLNTIFTNGRSFGQDGSGSDNTILIPDFVEAMKSTGRTFDFLLFDACYMGTAEVCYDFREVTDYQIVSVLEVPAYGFPYDMFMSDLYKGNVEGYKKVCQAFIDFNQYLYDETSSLSWGTVSLVDSEAMEALAVQLKSQLVAHKDALADFNVKGLQEYGKDSGKYISFDMEQFVKNLNGGVVPDAFKNQLAKTVLYKACLEKARPSNYSVDATNYCGLGMYIPVVERPKWNAWFKTIDWFTVSGWSEVDFSWNF